jgi:hypothetical protein
MNLEQIGFTEYGNVKHWQGLSTDIKPTTDLGAGSTFWELDTEKGFVFSKLHTNPVTSNGWWEV